jgi:ribose transport system ATP-binding protein
MLNTHTENANMSPVAEALQANPVLEMQGITKRFPGVTALDNVSFVAYGGEVHALMGENGAGKSTLMKILTGVYHQDEGHITLAGQTVKLSDPRSAQHHGLAIIHQELNQVPELSVVENFFLGREQRNRFGVLDKTFMRSETKRWLGELGLTLEVERKLRELRVAERQLLEIAKAISLQAKVLVMDEPTTALNTEEVARLFSVVRHLRENGMAIIYISHRMDEIFAIADRITVLRDGKLVGSKPAKELTRDSLIAMMVGRELTDLYPSSHREATKEMLSVKNLSVSAIPGRREIKEISLSVRAGEIVGLAGLLGSGRTEVLEALYGVPNVARVSGEIIVDGEIKTLKSPRDAIQNGIGFITEDRKGQSLVLVRSVGENASLAALSKFKRAGFLDLLREKKGVSEVVRELRVKTPTLETSVASLSGGNQQKVVLAKFLLTAPKVFLLDEPTQGIDVGAKAEIYALIDRLAKEGAAVILATSEMPELLALCDRILVMCEGRIAGELAKAGATQEAIMDLATRFAPHSVQPYAPMKTARKYS